MLRSVEGGRGRGWIYMNTRVLDFVVDFAACVQIYNASGRWNGGLGGWMFVVNVMTDSGGVPPRDQLYSQCAFLNLDLGRVWAMRHDTCAA